MHRRLRLLQFVEHGSWRDKAGMDGPLMRVGFPQASIQEADYWRDLIKVNTTVVFDRVVLVNRDTAHKQWVVSSARPIRIENFLRVLSEAAGSR